VVMLASSELALCKCCDLFPVETGQHFT